MLYKTPIDYSSFCVFGCLAFASTLTSHCTKFQPRATPCVFLGYPNGMKAYRLYDLQTKQIFVSQNVIFHEEAFPFHSVLDTTPLTDPFPDLVIPLPYSDSSPSYSLPPTSSQPDSQSSIDILPPSSQPTSQLPIRRSSRTIKPPSYLQDYHLAYSKHNSIPSSHPHPLSQVISYNSLSPSYRQFVLQISSTFEPQYYHQAIKLPEWREAMQAELAAMELNNTWSVTPLPPGKNSVGCRWIYKIKHKSDGSIERHKAHLVTKGYTQQERVDYVDTFSPVAKLIIVKVLLALAASKQWSLFQLDVNNAFLNGDLFEEVYMDLPLGYHKKGEHASYTGKLVCKLHKSIDGLKRASRQWYAKFSHSLLQFAFSQSKSDYSLFTKGSGSSFFALLVYVDDIIITGPSILVLNSLKQFLYSQFKLKDLGSLKFFLGLEIARADSGIVLSQCHYVLQLLEDTGFLGCKPAQLPMDPKAHLTASDGTLLIDPSQYRRLIGRLLYLTLSSPDITFVVHKLSQFVAQPCDSHLHPAHHLLRYLKHSPGQGLFFSAHSTLQLKAFSDVN